jgi:hypothetical protein
MLIFGKQHLQTVLPDTRPTTTDDYRSRQLRPPRPDHPIADVSHERIKRRLALGGLISEYERVA